MSSSNRPVRKRTNLVREEQLRQIAGMHLEKLPQRVIAAKLGLSQSQISRDLKEIQQRWRNSHHDDLPALLAKELALLDHIEQETWLAWHQSCQPEETQSQEKMTSDCDAGNGGIQANERQKSRLKASLRTKGRHGSQGLMKIIIDCARERRKLLGLDSHQVEQIVPQVMYIETNVAEEEKSQADVRQIAGEETNPDDATRRQLPLPDQLKPDPLRQVLAEFAQEAGNPLFKEHSP